MTEFELPDGWLTQVTVDCFEQVSTNNSSVKTKDCMATGQFPVIDQGQAFIAGYTDDSSKVVKLDSPIVVFGDHTRVVKWVDFDFVPGADGTKLLKPQNYLYPRFFYHQFKSLEIPDKGYARHFKHLRELQFFVPPLAEQKVIADKLDTLLAQVDNTKARLDRIPEILKSFRQSVLAAAVSGKLTEAWDATELSVKDLCIAGFDGPFGSKLKSSDYSDSGVRVARLENIGHLYFDNSKKTYISEVKYSSLIKNTLENGDVLFSSFVDETVNVCVFNNNDETFINKADCFCLRPRTSSVNSQFLSYVLASRTSYEQIKNQVQGVTRPRINLSILKGLTFKIPPIEQQLEIVLKVEELFAFADRIEQAAQAGLSRVNNLTQSILAKAFRGELTADWRAANPDLISGDNSAEALLANIKAERAAFGKARLKK